MSKLSTRNGIDLPRLRVELARKGLTQIQLAQKLDVPPTSLSGWLRGVHPAPEGLHRRISEVLGVSVRRSGGRKERQTRRVEQRRSKHRMEEV
jgi:transcriptional regulator with XRE-family HTH domain